MVRPNALLQASPCYSSCYCFYHIGTKYQSSSNHAVDPPAPCFVHPTSRTCYQMRPDFFLWSDLKPFSLTYPLRCRLNISIVYSKCTFNFLLTLNCYSNNTLLFMNYMYPLFKNSSVDQQVSYSLGNMLLYCETREVLKICGK